MRIAALILFGSILAFAAHQVWSALGGAAVLAPREATALAVGGRVATLAEVRRSCRVSDIDAFLGEQRALVDAGPDDGEAWAVLALAYLERIYTRDLELALVPGEPTHTSLPPEQASDIEAGLAASDRALALGEETASVWRVRMGLLSARVTGLGSALAAQADIDHALGRAVELDPVNPRVQVAVGLRKLFAPRMLGQDLAGALSHLLAAAPELPFDERPLVFAALASHMLGEDERAMGLLRDALACTPANPMARAALHRLKAGDAAPFGEDVD